MDTLNQANYSIVPAVHLIPSEHVILVDKLSITMVSARRILNDGIRTLVPWAPDPKRSDSLSEGRSSPLTEPSGWSV